jgi:hypothetical protein
VAFTLEQVDEKIAQARRVLDYWTNLKEALNNPLFAELSIESQKPSPAANHPTGIPIAAPPSWSGSPKSQYGRLKRLALECLPAIGNGVTPRGLADLISKTGYVFQTKTPYISVNDALNTLRKERKALLVGKSNANAGLWIRAEVDIFKEIERSREEQK